MSNSRKLLGFINRMMLEKDPKIDSLELRHVKENGTYDSIVIARYKLPFEDGMNPSQIIDDIETRAQEDADGFNGPQRYVLLGKHGKTQVFGRSMFRVIGEGDESRDGTPTEGPSIVGVLSQQMRHNEITMRTSMAAIATVTQRLTGMVDKLMGERENMIEGQIKVFEMKETLMNEQAERELEKQKAEQNAEMVREGMNMAQAYIPALLRGFAKKNKLELPPASKEMTPVEGLIDQIAGSLDDEQMMKLLPILKPNQQMALMELLSAAKDRHERVTGEKDDDG